jgi:hypothetical protein
MFVLADDSSMKTPRAGSNEVWPLARKSMVRLRCTKSFFIRQLHPLFYWPKIYLKCSGRRGRWRGRQQIWSRRVGGGEVNDAGFAVAGAEAVFGYLVLAGGTPAGGGRELVGGSFAVYFGRYRVYRNSPLGETNVRPAERACAGGGGAKDAA